jgi:UDPglucose 6-dehydrogenase
MTRRPETICYIGGCGRLGLSMAAWCAQQGYRVFCADVNAEAVAEVQASRSPINEPGLTELVETWSGKRLFATTDTAAAVTESDVSCIVVPTPSQPDGSFSLTHVLAACDSLASALARKTSYHLVLVVSTVMPGHTGGLVRQGLERSGKRAGRDFGLAYVPSYVRQGSILRDFAAPDLVLIGELNERSGEAAQSFYASVVTNRPGLYHMSPVSAEIAKLGLNVALVMKMAAANQLAWLCQRYPGADARDVLEAMGGDSRIGPACLQAGTWPGGPCLPRDTAALAAAFESSILARLADALRDFSHYQARVLADLACGLAEGPVGILGLTYKPGTDILDSSQGMELAWVLERRRRDVLRYDPCTPQLNDGTLESVVGNCAVLVLMTPWSQFRALEEMDLNGKTIVDMWGFLDEKKLNCDRYLRFGEGK